MADYGSFDTNRIKHMEMIQAVVARLAGNSSLVKGWALTLTGAFIGFAVNTSDWGLAAAALLPILGFWMLSTYYLRSERLFRVLYERVRSGDEAVEPFLMDATSKESIDGAPEDFASWRSTAGRPTLLGFYGLLLAATGLAVLIICSD